MINKIFSKIKVLLRTNEGKKTSFTEPQIKHGEKGIKEVGHRNYVGGLLN